MSEVAIALARKFHGVVTRRALENAGMTRSEIRWLGQSGEWTSLVDNVFIRRGSPNTIEQRLAVAVSLVGPTAVLSHETAAWLWGLTGCRPMPASVLTSSTSRVRRARDVTVRRCTAIPERWLATHRQLPTVRPEVVAIHLFADFTPQRAERLVEQMWSRRLLSGRSIAACLSDLGARGRNGIAGLRRYLNDRGQDYEPAASGVELRFQQIMEGAGLAFRRQVDVGDEVWIGRVDFLAVDAPLIVEIQSEMYHASLVDRDSDARRLAALSAAGFTVLEVWDSEVFHRPYDVITRVREALRVSASA